MSILTGGSNWPPEGEREAWSLVNYYAALRDGLEGPIRQQARARQMGADPKKPYIAVPLPGLIARVPADLLFGEEPRFIAADENDQEALAELIGANGLPAELHRAAIVSASEGEVWGRVLLDPAASPRPLIEFFSRSQVVPVWRGRVLAGAAVIHPYKDGETYYRLVEEHEPGVVRHVLYKGTRSTLGREVELSTIPAGAGLAPEVATGYDRLLITRIPNMLGADPTLGVSDYQALEPLFLAINETATVAQHNMRLTAAKRLFVDRTLTDKRGRFDLSDDVVYMMSGRGEKALGEAPPPIQQFAYEFEAAELLAYSDHLVDQALTLAGISPVSIGRGDTGGASSGTALRLRMAHTLAVVAGKGRHFDRGVQELLTAAQALDAANGAQWANPAEAPTMVRADGLPGDPTEDARVIATLASAEAISIEERVRRVHPDWDDQRVENEVGRIEGAAIELPPLIG